MKPAIISILLFFLSSSMSLGQETVVYDNHVYKEYIKSVEFSHNNVPLTLPVVDFNSGGRLKLEFDDIEGGYRTYLYKIVHCDKDWYPSNLNEIEYLDGFNNEEIQEFRNSLNAYSNYTHYQLTLPNDDLRWNISGNFVLIITDDETEDLVLSRRFVVSESVATIAAQFVKPQNVANIRTNQDLQVSLDISDFRLNNPLNDVYLTVIQNGNWHSAQTNINPVYQNNNALFFDQYEILTFPALKEFRNFDTRSIRYSGDYVSYIEQDNDETRVLLDLGRIRNKTHFEYERDANGGFIIDNLDRSNGDVTGEYTQVTFTLEMDPIDQDLFIVGSFNDWQPSETYRMEYDYDRNLYFRTAPFKQGYYDYMYGVMNERGKLDIDQIEGSWFETENDYLIIAYYRDIGAEYDRVLDVITINSAPR